MSYILDALKKAESERERERSAVPGLSSTQTGYSTYISYGGSYKPWWLVLLALGLLVALLLGTWAWRQAAGDALPAPAAKRQPEPVVAQTVVAQTVAQSASAPVSSRTVVPVLAKVAEPRSSPQAPALVPVPVTAPVPVPVPVPVPAPAPAPAVESASKAVPASPSPARVASGAMPLLGELPEAMRRQIPALNISGAIYSDAPPEWTLIINDQVMSRGSQVAPDLRLEDISASSAVFNFRGQRFRVDR